MSRYYHGNRRQVFAFIETKSVNELETSLHSPQRQLIEMRIEHADLDALIDRFAEQGQGDELALRRMKKRRLALRDQMARLEILLRGKEPA